MHGRTWVGIDGDDVFGFQHSVKMMAGSTDSARDVKIREHDLDVEWLARVDRGVNFSDCCQRMKSSATLLHLVRFNMRFSKATNMREKMPDGSILSEMDIYPREMIPRRYVGTDATGMVVRNVQ